MSLTVPFLRRAAVPGAVALVAAGLWAVPAAADPVARAPLAAEPTPASVEALPTVQVDKGLYGKDGAVVWSQAVVGNTVYAGGDFTVARPAGNQRGIGEIPRTHLLAYDITTGNLVTSFNHTLNGQVRGVAASPDGSRVYITGDFTEVDGKGRYRLAAFNTADGSLVESFRPVLSSAGLAVSATNSTVYVGGNFKSVYQKPGAAQAERLRLAAFAAADGAVRDFKADANAPVTALAVTAAGDRVAVGGRFTSLSGASLDGLGSVDPTTGSAQSFPVNKVIGSSGDQSSITSLYADSTGIYGTAYHWGGKGNLEGTFRADPTTGDLAWVADCYGDTYSVTQAGGVVYDASHHHDCSSTPGGFPEIRPAYHHANAYTVEAVGTDSGNHNRAYGWDHRGKPAPRMLDWYPDFMTGHYAGQGPWSVVGNSQYVSYGGEFLAVNNKKSQQGLVRFALPGAAPVVPTEDVDASYTSVDDGVVDATVTTGWGTDGEKLTYRLYRGPADAVGLSPEGATQVASKDATWSAGSAVTLTDSTARPGVTASYLVTVTNAAGKTVPTGGALASAWQQVKVAGTYRNVEPVASFTTATDGLRVTVDGTASADDSAVGSYSWSFGDQTAAVTGATASHTYASAGTYQVVLTVTDDEGAVGTATRQVTVDPTAGPSGPEPGPTPEGGPVAWYESTVSGMQVNVDGSGSCDCENQIVSYQWEFGDGTTGEGVTATHAYARAGTYRVVLIVTNDKGLVSAVYSDITIKP